MSEDSENAGERRPVAFISHHSSHHDVARHLKQVLHARGVDAWMAPDDVPLRKPFDEAIAEQIPQSDAMILLFSAAADKSTHIKREIMLADDEGVAVLPLRLEAIEPDRLRYLLKTNQWVDWMDRRDEVVARVVEQVSILAGVETPRRKARETSRSGSDLPDTLGINRWRTRRTAAWALPIVALIGAYAGYLAFFPDAASHSEADGIAEIEPAMEETPGEERPELNQSGTDDIIITQAMIDREPLDPNSLEANALMQQAYDEMLDRSDLELDNAYYCNPFGFRVKNNTDENLVIVYGVYASTYFGEVALSPGERQYFPSYAAEEWFFRDSEYRFFQIWQTFDCATGPATD